MPLSPKCPRCNLAFGTKDPKCPQGPRMPMMLDCGHTFCGDCLTRLAKQQRTVIVCPTCQQLTELSEECSVKSLWPDVYVHGLLAVNRSGFAMQPQVMEFLKPNTNSLNKTQPKPNLCEECSAKVATCRCIKCDVILCGVCFEKIHRVSNVLRQHHAEPFNSRDSDINYSKSVSPICSLHKRANEFYCSDEDVAFCATCAGLGGHKDHLVITTEDKEQSDLENLSTMLGQANNVLQHSKQSSQLVNSIVPACQSHGSRMIERLQEHFLQLHGTLQAREHCLINELLKTFQKDVGSVVEMEATLLEQIRKLEMILGDARAVISGTKRNLKGCQVLECLTEVLDVPCYATVAGGGNLQIQFKCEDENLLNEIQQHGLWDGHFVDKLTLDKLADVSVMNEHGERVPLVLPSISGTENVASPDMKNGGSDLDSVSQYSDFEHPVNHEPEIEPKFRPKGNLQENPAFRSKFKVRSEVVHVSHIYNPCNFYVNLSRDLSTLTTLSRNIATHCSYTGKRDIPHEVEVGDQVLAQFGQDGQWYRAEILELNELTPVNPATIRVLYTDYGNTELTTLERIRNTHPKFLQCPKMAKRCTLVDIVPVNGGRWSSETISTFARITKDRSMIMTVIKEDQDQWYVDLSRPASEEIEDDGPVSVRDALVFLGLASFISPHSVPSKTGGIKPRCYLRPGLPQFGESVRITMTYVLSPHDFYVQMLGSESRHLQELMMNMQKTYDEDRGDLYTLFCPAQGMLCVAKYEDDGMWYRAEVMELTGGSQVNIKYVDYGNIESVSVWKLKKLLDVYLVLPAQAVHCRLADIGPVEEGGMWPIEATTFLAKLLKEPELTLKVKEVVNRSTLSVYLHSEMMLHSVNTSMISNGWAVATGPGWEPPPKTPKSLFLIAKQQKTQANSELSKPPSVIPSQSLQGPHVNAGSKTDVNGEEDKPHGPLVTVSHVVSPGEFYVQDTEKIRSLQQLMTDLNKWVSDHHKDKSSVTHQWKMTDVCAVCTADDKRWYRGQIINVGESTAEVFLMDFGYQYTVEMSNLSPLPDFLKSVTRFTVRCHFADIVPAGDPSRWSQTSCEALKSMVLNKTCYLVVKDNMEESGSLPVNLLLEVFVKGGAVTPDTTLYNSVAEALRDRGLALKKRTSCSVIPSSRAMASPANYFTSGSAMLMSNQSLKAAEDVSCEQSKEKRPVQVQSPTVETTDDDYPPPDIPPSDKLVLGVTHIDKNGVIYGQEIKPDLRYLQQLLDRVANHYKNSPPSIGLTWREGELVVAQFTSDDGFYRAKILSLSGNFAEVYYVDYGNKETLSTERLRPPIFTDEPSQCYQCMLYGLAWNSGDGLPTEDVCSSMYQLLVGKVCNLQIKEEPKRGQPLVVEVTTAEGKDLSQFLVDAGFALKLEVRSVSPEDQDLSALSSPSEPSVRCQSPAKASRSLSSSTNVTPHRSDCQANRGPSPNESLKSGGGDCPDRSYSRTERKTAVVPSVESLQVLSQSVIDASDKTIPPAFPHPCGYGSWVGDAEVSLPGPVSCRIPKRKVPSPYLQAPEPRAGDMMIMTVTQVDAPDLVYLQCIKLENVVEESIIEVNNQLDQLLELNKWYGSSHETCPVLTANQLTPGRPCIAKYSVDGCWYRAEIVDVRLAREDSLEIDILFVDYGSSDCLTKLENVRNIPEDHMSLPAQATLCRLDGVLPRKDWTVEDLHCVEGIVKDKVLITSVKNVQNGEVFVDLFEQEVYTLKGVMAPLIYQPLVDEGILTLSAVDATSTSESHEDFCESGPSEKDADKSASRSDAEGEERMDDPCSDV